MKELENITTFVLKPDGTIHIDNMEEYLKSCDIVEKKLKALEIIKNCSAIIGVYETVDGKCYLETGKDNIKLCKEDYDLLKEVLL